MKDLIGHETAAVYASWFRCLAEPTRLRILHALACARRPMRVGELAEAVGVAQSTVSVHLRRLLDDEFVLVERIGTASWFTLNESCIEQFPAAAKQVMGSLTGYAPAPASAVPPWRERAGGPAGPA
ncbi:ArsR/SmtB family transcription factor [Allosalinactinospora lopnorensis]|uniref:ArsR/SmtB family transcription factor n=1 Tax=Allosalinactinospora lopnorensis TaxID=1352348 RepID=UPI000623F0D9|nr:metalloregulator ArsR/SmtB family transcription factor [Allosalinactinospora lopnorensis]